LPIRLAPTRPGKARPYKVPWYPVLPTWSSSMSLFAAGVYGVYGSPSDEPKLPSWFFDMSCFAFGIMYIIGLAYFFGFARRRLVTAAPEESGRARGPRIVVQGARLHGSCGRAAHPTTAKQSPPPCRRNDA